MKKIQKLVISGLAVLLMLCMSISLVVVWGSCFTVYQEKEEKYLNEYMSKIPTDISGYQFCNLNESGAIKIENMSGDFIV